MVTKRKTTATGVKASKVLKTEENPAADDEEATEEESAPPEAANTVLAGNDEDDEVVENAEYVAVVKGEEEDFDEDDDHAEKEQKSDEVVVEENAEDVAEEEAEADEEDKPEDAAEDDDEVDAEEEEEVDADIDNVQEEGDNNEHRMDLDESGNEDEGEGVFTTDVNTAEGPGTGQGADALVAQRTEGKKVRKQQRKVKNKRPKDMPTRPLSAYNYFFREARIKWLDTKPEVLDKSKVWEPEPDGRKIKSRLFESMAKEIAHRWKELPSDLRQPFIEKADDDMNRYRADMELYQQRRVLERGGRKAKKSDKLKTKSGRQKKAYDASGKLIAGGGYSANMQPLSSTLTAASAKYNGASNIPHNPGEKRGRGRPPGAKNKKTLAAETAAVVGGYIPVPNQARKQPKVPTLPTPKPGAVPTQGGGMPMHSAGGLRAKAVGRNFNFPMGMKNDMIGGPIMDPIMGNPMKKGKKQMLTHPGTLNQAQIAGQYGGRPGNNIGRGGGNMRGSMGGMSDDIGYGNFRSHDPMGSGMDGSMVPMGRNQMNDPSIMRKPMSASMNPNAQGFDFANLSDDQLRALLEQQSGHQSSGAGGRGFDTLVGRSPNSSGAAGSFGGSAGGTASNMDMMNRQLQSQQYKLQMMQNQMPMEPNVRGMGSGGGFSGSGMDPTYGMPGQGYGPSGGYSGSRGGGGGDSLSMQGMNAGFGDISERGGPMTGRRPSSSMLVDDNASGSGNNYQLLQLLAAQQGGSSSGAGGSSSGGVGGSGGGGGYAGYSDFHGGYQ